MNAGNIENVRILVILITLYFDHYYPTDYGSCINYWFKYDFVWLKAKSFCIVYTIN